MSIGNVFADGKTVDTSFRVRGAKLHLHGSWRSSMRLAEYGVDGKQTGSEPLFVPGDGGPVSLKLLSRLPAGMYILSLVRDGAVPEKTVYCRILIPDVVFPVKK
ncbi:MAG: hypothetical protein JW863_11330 [Chitinispirillaceae bacterium]|nr:hypothetical protein [Chitinispirillaceae bacterium]